MSTSITLCILLSMAGTGQTRDAAGDAFFEAKVRPVLAEHCYSCHSAHSGKSKGGLALDTREAIRAGGDRGAAVVPNRPDKSLLIAAIRDGGTDGVPRMPPRGALPPAVVADLVKWVEIGAPDPREGAKPAPSKGMTVADGRRFWSMVSPKAEPAPVVKQSDWPRTPIDRFILQKLESAKLEPAPDASRHTLLRRITFDLTGLPPTPSEVDAFVNDRAADAFERVVDRLLASSSFGERWGRHWLDLARYGESNGGARNMAWHHAWHYRDYVIDAFNDDVPYDQFLREQIAGDLLPARTAAQRDRQLIATGFLALGSKPFEEVNANVFHMNIVDEQIEVTTRTMLGLSVACARCHDHKFDPIPTVDYYALAGIFRSTALHYGKGDKFETNLKPIGPHVDERAKPAADHLRAVQETTKKMIDARIVRYGHIRRVADLKQQLEKPGVDHAKIGAELADREAKVAEWDVIAKAFEKQLKELEAKPPAQPDFALAAGEASKVDDCRVHIRGETTSLGPAVPRGMLQVIPFDGVISRGESGRLQLAQWLTRRENPLTARVMVNRVWRQLLGRGIVASPDDFGVTGSAPTHPELLDALAVEFMDNGWSVKKLIRSIVLSRTYQLSTEAADDARTKDADNTLFGRGALRRLEVEAFRDAALMVAGRLQGREPNAVARLDPFKQTELTPATLKADQLDHRSRTVYGAVARGQLPEILKLFDFADPYRSIAVRDETVVPAQAAFLVNSPWMIEQARHLSQRAAAESLDDEQRLEFLYKLLFARTPTAAERDRVMRFLDRNLDRNLDRGAERLEGWISVCHALLASAEFRYLD